MERKKCLNSIIPPKCMQLAPQKNIILRFESKEHDKLTIKLQMVFESLKLIVQMKEMPKQTVLFANPT